MAHSAKSRRLAASLTVALISLGIMAFGAISQIQPKPGVTPPPSQPAVLSDEAPPLPLTGQAADALKELAIKGRAPKTGYTRSQFGNGWASVAGCDMRNRILQRDLENPVPRDDGCVVLSGTLHDPYTDTVINFMRGNDTSNAVQIDHIVALSDAWQKGAQSLSAERRQALANDPLNLLAVDGPTNTKKGDGDAATWLPPNTAYRCRYVARQIAVKAKYSLWVTQAEHDAMSRILGSCPGQLLPVVTPTR